MHSRFHRRAELAIAPRLGLRVPAGISRGGRPPEEARAARGLGVSRASSRVSHTRRLLLIRRHGSLHLPYPTPNPRILLDLPFPSTPTLLPPGLNRGCGTRYGTRQICRVKHDVFMFSAALQCAEATMSRHANKHPCQHPTARGRLFFEHTQTRKRVVLPFGLAWLGDGWTQVYGLHHVGMFMLSKFSYMYHTSDGGRSDTQTRLPQTAGGSTSGARFEQQHTARLAHAYKFHHFRPCDLL